MTISKELLAPMGSKVTSLLHNRSRSQDGKQVEWDWEGPPGHHSPFPIDSSPYPGHAVQYCFIDIMASYKIMLNQVNLGPQAVTTNIDDNLHELQECYKNNFILKQFLRIPGIKCTVNVQDWTERQPYQAILCRNTHGGNADEKYQLVIEKQLFSTGALPTTEYSTEHDLINTISHHAAKGGRLVCAEPIGYVHSDCKNKQYTVMGVDLFFNIPRHPRPQVFSYHTINVPINYYINPKDSQISNHLQCDADWTGQLKIFLDRGWKLIDICMDATTLANALKVKTTSLQIDTMWIFEKRKDRLTNSSPEYEGVIIEYLHKVKSTPDGETPCRDWRPVIAGMGVSGWELATVIQTPMLHQCSFTTYNLKLLMFFQRRMFMVKQPSQLGTIRTGSTGRRARIAYRNEPGYYNHSLRKYIYARDVEYLEYDDAPIYKRVGTQNVQETMGATSMQNGLIPSKNKQISKPMKGTSMQNGHAHQLANGHAYKN